MLALLMQFKFGIAISGTHGKTTTTSMIFDIFKNSKLSPTCINGGLIKSVKSYSHLGISQYFIVEADESDASLLFLKPSIAIVTNIESDHMDYYNGDFEKLKNTFFVFLKQIPYSGTAILCIDNRILFDFSYILTCNVITYGFHKNADVWITKYTQNGFFSYFTLVIQNKLHLKITLNMPGKHNALNAAAAVALAISQGVKNDKIIKTLKYFQGTERRFDLIGKLWFQKNHVYKKNIMLIDDYGHHPTALSENIKTIRISWPKKKLIMIFQPHRYTRTHYLYNDFINVLSQVDILLILNVYSANEKHISGANSFSLYHDIKTFTNLHNITLISNHNLILDTLIKVLQNNDIVLLQGAGNIKNIVYKMLSKKNIKLNK
jgi:UDP-N-acetylmuramate--alanine ligase